MVNQAFTTLALAVTLERAFSSSVHAEATRHDHSTLFVSRISEKENVSTPSAINYEHKLSGSEKATITRNLEIQQLSLRGDPELVECYENMVMADETGDSYLSDEEYIEFIHLQSKGFINVAVFGQMDYHLVTYFYHAEMCCDLGIDLEGDDLTTLEETVKYVCDSVMKRLAQLIPPTTPPTTTPSLQPSSLPTPTPSSLPLQSQEAVVSNEAEEEENEEPPAVTRSKEPEESGISFGILIALVGVLALMFVIVIVLRKNRLLDQRKTVVAVVSDSKDGDFAESEEVQ